jgi:hypothetical protein
MFSEYKRSFSFDIWAFPLTLPLSPAWGRGSPACGGAEVYLPSAAPEATRGGVRGPREDKAKGATQGIGKSNTWLRKVVADLRKRVLLLEKENRRQAATMKKYRMDQP